MAGSEDARNRAEPAFKRKEEARADGLKGPAGVRDRPARRARGVLAWERYSWHATKKV